MRRIELETGHTVMIKTPYGTVTVDCSHFNFVDIRANEGTEDPKYLGSLTTQGYRPPVKWDKHWAHGLACAIRFSSAAECTCGKVDALAEGK